MIDLGWKLHKGAANMSLVGKSTMKKIAPVLAIMASLGLAGCESSAGSGLLGGVAGAAAGAGGYEFHLQKQRDRVEEDFRVGEIGRAEYDIRIDQINRDSLLR